MDVLNQLFSTFKVSANVFHNGQYCGNWAIDTSGTTYISFHIVSYGRCFLSIDQGKTLVETLEQGDIVLFPRDCKHCITNDKSFSLPVNTETSTDYQAGLIEGGTGLICGYFSHQHPMISTLTNDMPEYIVIHSKAEQGSSTLSLLIKALLEESLHGTNGSNWVLNKMSEAILGLLFTEHLSTEQGLLAAILHPKIGAAIEAIHQQPNEKWTVEKLAAISHLSRAAFASLFKQLVDLSPIEYVAQWRFSLAYRLLADDKVSILEAALECGYENESSFSKAFKRVLGVTPGKVRAELSKS